MKTISKKTLLITCMVCLIASVSLVVAITPLTVDFGSVTINPKPADVIIISATWNGTTVNSVNEQSVVFTNIPNMDEGDEVTVTVKVHNKGSESTTISATPSTQAALTFTPLSNPSTVAGHTDATFTFTAKANTVSTSTTVTPSISITWP